MPWALLATLSSTYSSVCGAILGFRLAEKFSCHRNLGSLLGIWLANALLYSLCPLLAAENALTLSLLLTFRGLYLTWISLVASTAVMLWGDHNPKDIALSALGATLLTTPIPAMATAALLTLI